MWNQRHTGRPTDPLDAATGTAKMNDISVPFEFVIWDANQCAKYLGQEYSTFIKRTQYLRDFPSRCPVPGQPRWQAKSVAQWALTGTTPDSRQTPATD